MRVFFKNRLPKGFATVAISFLIWPTIRASAAEDVSTLMARVLATNSPWLTPKPSSAGTFQILERPDAQADMPAGPFSLDLNVTNSYAPLGNAFKMGSIVWTPLHVMANEPILYTLSYAGQTNFNQQNLLIIEVVFSSDVRNNIGMGGQAWAFANANYSDVNNARIFVDPTNAIAVYMETHSSPTNKSQFNPTWQFDPLFYQVSGGLAPRSFDWSEQSTFQLEHQEFQVVNGVWIFRRGDAWFGTIWGEVGHILSGELIDLKIGVMAAARISFSKFVIDLPPGDTGIVESADDPRGPWSAVLSQPLPFDNIRLSVPMATNKAAQFYRLRK